MHQSLVYEKLVLEHGLSSAQNLILSEVKMFLEENPGALILELGSSSGYMTKIFKQMGGVVDIVEIDDQAIKKAKRFANNAFYGSIEDTKVRKKIKKKYNLIISADVLEHLVDPEGTLQFLKSILGKHGVIIISIPNIAFWGMRKHLFFEGDFKYQESGLLDKTHLRFYSFNNFLNLLRENKLKVVKVLPAEVRVPFEYKLKRLSLVGKFILHYLKKWLASRWPNLAIYHYVVIVRL